MPFRGSYEQNAQESGGGNWLGFQEVALTDIVDKSADYPNMGMFLEIYFDITFSFKKDFISSFE